MAFLFQFVHCWRFLRGYPLRLRIKRAWQMTRLLRHPEKPLFDDDFSYWP